MSDIFDHVAGGNGGDIFDRVGLSEIAKIRKQRIEKGEDLPPGTPQHGPAARLFNALGLPTNVAELEAMAQQFQPLSNPVAAGGPGAVIASNLARTVGGEMGTQAGEAADAAQHGEIGNALKHAAGAAIPLIGPPAAEGDIATALGRGANLALAGGLRGAGEIAGENALGTMAKVTGDRPLAQEMLESGNARMANPPEQIAAYAQDRIPQDIPEPAKPGQFQTKDIREMRGRAAKYERIRDEVAPNAMKPNAPSATDAISRIMKKGVLTSAAYAMNPTLGKIVAGTAGAGEVAGYIRDVLNSPKYMTALAELQNGFANAVRSRDYGALALYGQAIQEGDH